MEYQEIATDDIDQLFSWGSGWELTYLQLTRGKLGFRTRFVRLPDVLIEWNTYGQAVLFREILTDPALFFGVTLDAPDAPVYRGRELATNDALLYRFGQQQDYRVHPNTNTLVVAISPPLMQTLGWEFSPQPIHRVSRHLLDRLIVTCEDITALAMTSDVSTVDTRLEFALRDRVVVALRELLEPWETRPDGISRSANHESRAFRLVHQAQGQIDKRNRGEKFSIAGLAAELEVSERVVYDSFRTCLGIGPYEYHLLRQLHCFRETILAGKPTHGKITQAAILAGFSHMGRLTQFYRRQFGETPRQTMRRRDAQISR